VGKHRNAHLIGHEQSQQKQGNKQLFFLKHLHIP
jgi:hypothetical protein